MLFQYRNTADANLMCLQCAVLTEFNVWQISEAFKRFGISDSDSAVHIVLVYNKDETLNIEDIISKVDGEQMAVDRVSDLTDAAKIKKVCLLLHSTDVEQVRVHRLLHLFEMDICVSHYSSTKSHHWRKSVAVFWTLLFAGWPLKMLHS